MIKYFSLDSLNEIMGDGEEARILAKEVVSDSLFKEFDGWMVFYLEDDEQKILEKYPNIKLHYLENNLLLHDFKDFINDFDWNLKNFKKLQINEVELTKYAQDSWQVVEEWQDGIMEAKDVKKYFNEINSIIINNYISTQLNLIFQEIKNNNIEIDWNLVGLSYIQEEV